MLVSMLDSEGTDASRRHIVRLLNEVVGAEALTDISLARDHEGNGPNVLLVEPLVAHQRRTGAHLLIAERIDVDGRQLLLANDRRGTRWWAPVDGDGVAKSLERLKERVGGDIIVVPHGSLLAELAEIQPVDGVLFADFLFPPLPYVPPTTGRPSFCFPPVFS